MKAFMTACAVLASSVNADPQMISNVVNLGHTVSHPSLIHPYNGVPLNQVSFTNANAYDLNYPLTTYTMAAPTYQLATLPNTHQFIKREAEPESPYVIRTKISNPVEGSKQEVQVKVDRSGKGQSFQHVEQKDAPQVMHDNYIMEYRRMARRPLVSKMYVGAHRGTGMNHQMGMNQMRMDRNQMGMDMNQVGMYISDYQQRLEEITKLREQREQNAQLAERLHKALAAKSQNIQNPTLGNTQQGTVSSTMGEELLPIEQMIYTDLKNAVRSHNQIGDKWGDMANAMIETLESHNDLGLNLMDAIQLYDVKIQRNG